MTEMKTYTQNGVKYISHKDALAYYGCTPATIKNWRESGRLKFIEFPLNSGRLYAMDPELRKYHLGGERFDGRQDNRNE